MINALKSDLNRLANPEKARILARFFKTGKGQYGEGDVFLGIPVPEQRRIAKKYRNLPLGEIRNLLASQVHEHRLVALLVLISQYRQTDDQRRNKIVAFYLNNSDRINNWDLVDISAPSIVGDHLADKDKSVLYDFARSEDLWRKRIAIIATLAFIRKGDFIDAFALSEILLRDPHDLIHKAVGWMLREIGKRDRKAEEKFLRKHCRNMPRTMLRYAIEHFDDDSRRQYLKK